jgi:hypothetical protein
VAWGCDDEPEEADDPAGGALLPEFHRVPETSQVADGGPASFSLGGTCGRRWGFLGEADFFVEF